MNSTDCQKLIILGDFVICEEEENDFSEGIIEKWIDKDVLDFISNADYRLCNLEAPLTNSNNKIAKCGPNLKVKPECINGINKLGINLVTLANNHILDYGTCGINDTTRILSDNAISFCGVGNNKKEAATPFYFNLGERRIGVYCCAETEFSIATNHSMGANGFDPFYSLDEIMDAKKNCDYLIVLHHGGKELYRYPSPGLTKTCSRMIDKGADLVICQHSHCIGSEITYKGSKIIFGQGNFFFNRKHNEYWDSGLIVSLTFSRDRISIELLPIVNKAGIVRFADRTESELIMKTYKQRSSESTNDCFLEDKFRSFALSRKKEYFKTFLGGKSFASKIYRVITRLLPKKRCESAFYKQKDYSELINYIMCESHRELLMEILQSEKNYE